MEAQFVTPEMGRKGKFMLVKSVDVDDGANVAVKVVKSSSKEAPMIPLDEERVDADDEPSTAAAAQHLRFLRGTILFMSALIVLLVVAIIAMAVHLPSRRTESLQPHSAVATTTSEPPRTSTASTEPPRTATASSGVESLFSDEASGDGAGGGDPLFAPTQPDDGLLDDAVASNLIATERETSVESEGFLRIRDAARMARLAVRRAFGID